MAFGNAQSAEQDHFDLLPFIAIMMCLLGTLLLVTMCMAAINIGAGAGEGWVLEPDAAAKKPVLIEWDGQFATWHSEQGLQRIENNFIEYAMVRGHWLRFDPNGREALVPGPQPNALDPLLDYLAARQKTHYALFAVRPGGFHNFRKFSARFAERGIDTGSEPIEQGKPVSLIAPPGGPPVTAPGDAK
jgi:hypothetical protein